MKYLLKILLVFTLGEETVTQLVLANFNPEDNVKENVPQDAKLNFIELSDKYNHPAEEYQIVTEDKYILTMFHIPGKGSTVFLEHGIIDSSDTFIIRGDSSLAIVLSQAGYDVWLGNARGNKYSRRHVYLNPDTDKHYWNFSMHEIGYYDLPAMIDFVLEKTNNSQLTAIGHSQGNAIFYVLGATKPDYNKKINVLIALAPICFLQNVKPPINVLVAFSPAINNLLLGIEEEELMNTQSASKALITLVCSEISFYYEICAEAGLFFLAGSDPRELEKDFLKVVIGHYPTGTSRTNAWHLAQIARSQRFQYFDHGPQKNFAEYGSEKPPEYNLTKVTMKVELFVGKNDKLSTVEDVRLLKKKLPNSVYQRIGNSKMNHLDFVWGKHMKKYLFPPIFQVLQKYST